MAAFSFGSPAVASASMYAKDRFNNYGGVGGDRHLRQILYGLLVLQRRLSRISAAAASCVSRSALSSTASALATTSSVQVAFWRLRWQRRVLRRPPCRRPLRLFLCLEPSSGSDGCDSFDGLSGGSVLAADICGKYRLGCCSCCCCDDFCRDCFVDSCMSGSMFCEYCKGDRLGTDTFTRIPWQRERRKRHLYH
jgi:hypothetical protein